MDGSRTIRMRSWVAALVCALALALAAPGIAGAEPAVPAFTGVVTDLETTESIEGAEVWGWYYDEDTDEYYEDWTYTDVEGEYELYLPAGTYDLGVWAHTYMGEHASEMVFDGVTATEKNFALQPLELAFHGVVKDAETSAPIEFASVDAWYDDGDDWGYYTWDETDETGAYEIYAPAGTYTVSAYMRAYLPEQVDAAAFNGVTAEKLDFTLEPLDVAFYGTVSDAKSSDPIEGVEVMCNSDDGDYGYYDWTESDIDGQYELYAPAGTYSLAAWPEETHMSSYVSDMVFDGDNAVQHDFALEPIMLAFQGVVTDAETTLPLEFAEVAVEWYEDDWGYSHWTETNTDGEYELYAPEGVFSLYAAKRAYLPVRLYDMAFDGENVVTQNFALEPLDVAFYGIVTDASTTDPIEGADVVAYYWGEEDEDAGYFDWCETDADGYYELYAPEGTYTLEARTYRPLHYAPARYVDMAFDGVDAVEQNFALDPLEVAFRGTVTNAADSKPIKYAHVTAEYWSEDEEYYDWVETEADGTYELYAPAGTYEMSAAAHGYGTQLLYDMEFDGQNAVEQDFALFKLTPLVADAYEPDNTISSSKLIADNGVMQERTLFPKKDVDWIKLNVVSGVTYTIETHSLGKWGADTHLFLFDTNGLKQLAENDDNEDTLSLYSKIEWTANATKVVYIKVTHFGGDGTGDYGLNVTSDAQPGKAITVAGGNRFDTAIKASVQAYPAGLAINGKRTVVIATGMNWPDALGGTSLAGALDGPVLLVDGKTLSSAVVNEITRLNAVEAIILGGKLAVGDDVEKALKAKLGTDNVERIDGANRYVTADKVAKRVIEERGGSFDGKAFVATGGNFPDALAAAPLAAAKGWPLYLSDPVKGLSAGTKVAMAGVTDAVILGGTKVVPGTVHTELETKLGGKSKVVRLNGANRYETAAKVAAHGVNNAGLKWNLVGITTGENFPDALAGGVVQGKAGSVMLLTLPTKLDPYAAGALKANKNDIFTVTYFGGDNAVGKPVKSSVTNALN